MFRLSTTYPEEGSLAPDFTLNSEKGNALTLHSLQGKNIVLFFYPKDDTPGCTKEACSFRDNFDKLNLNNTVYSLSEKAGALMVLGGSFTQVKDLGYNYLALAEGISAMTPGSLTIQQSVDGISLNIVGEIGEIYVLEISEDLVTWLKLSDAIIPESGSQKIDLGPSSSNRYFRAVYRE